MAPSQYVLFMACCTLWMSVAIHLQSVHSPTRAAGSGIRGTSFASGSDPSYVYETGW